MPWQKTPEDRRRDQAIYGSPEYKRNREAAKRRAGGRCEVCQHPHTRLQADHIIPVSQGGGHSLANLRMSCTGPGTCQCHDKKTATEGGGYRNPGRSRHADPQPRRSTLW
jgi:5-methylcytosine-specific restriction endonuclease McrA